MLSSPISRRSTDRTVRAGALLLALVALAAVAITLLQGRSHATTRAELIRPVEVTITDTRITLSHTSLLRGLIAQFRVSNESGKPRNFVAGVERTKVILAPGDRAKLLVDLEKRGPLPYRVTVNCGPGLQGLFSVG